ncbi:MAG: hemolysin family protein [Verrucomicrobia bacterium]|jgi:CBS domain containing-hemolysin-like protein|nr:hemolysin family protein [Verrucomicrobiota bacterium]
MELSGAIAIAGKIIAVIVLVFLNGFFVAAEFALVKLRDTQLSPLIRRGNRRAKVARLVLSRLDSFLSAAQLGITLASLALGWIGEPVFSALLAPVFSAFQIEDPHLREGLAFAVGFSVITFLHISAGEQAPKMLAIQKPLAVSLWIAYPLLGFYYVSYPFVYVLNHTSQWLLRQAGLEGGGGHEGAHSEEELRLLFAESQRRAGGSALGREIVVNALDLRRRIVRDVMRPRQEITVLNTEAPMSACLEVAERTRYSRFPLCEAGDVDQSLATVHIKDLYALRNKAKTGRDLLAAARRLIYVPETARLERLLQLFLEQKLHLALVVDEYGGTQGLVTLENILEELVGQIQDEFDQEKPLLVPMGPDLWESSGLLPLHELEEIVGQTIDAEDLTTVSGYVTQQLGGFPKVGDSLTIGEWRLRVEAVDGIRVARLRIVRTPPPPEA